MAKRRSAFCIRFERVECGTLTYDIESTSMLRLQIRFFTLSRFCLKLLPVCEVEELAVR